MLYVILRFIVTIAVRIFFRTLHVKNADLVPDNGPLIIVANHPSTFMDPMVIGSYIKQPLHFISKGSLFTGWFVRMLLHSLHMIPIYRKQDNPDLIDKNEDSFRQCYVFLAKRKALLIFPEGISKSDRRLDKIKTGAARIALGAEASADYRLGLTIVPVGLNYTEVGTFRSDLFISFADPIDVSTFFDLYREDDRRAVNALTDHIRQRLEEHTISIENASHAELVEQIESLYKSKLSDDIGLSIEEKADDFRLTKGILEAVEYFSRKDPQRVSTLQRKLRQYYADLDRLHLKDDAVHIGDFRRSLSIDSIKTAAFILCGFPIYMCGVAGNYPPYKLIDILTGKVFSDVEYQGPVKLVLGVFLFPLFYGLQLWMIAMLFNTWWLTLGYGILLPVSGFFALYYWDRLVKIRGVLVFMSLFYRESPLIARLIQHRLAIVDILEKAQQDYLEYTSSSGEK